MIIPLIEGDPLEFREEKIADIECRAWLSVIALITALFDTVTAAAAR
jgi:hypothetical protein